MTTRFRELLPLYAVIFAGFLGYALTITLFIPLLLDKNFALLPATSPTPVRMTVAGFLLAMYPLGQFLGSPVIGNLSDHYGRKKVLLISLIASIIGFSGIALSIQLHQLTLLFVFCFLTGLFESNMAISQSVIVDKYQDPTLRHKLIGYAVSACSLGYVIGPLLGGFGGTALGYGSPFWITALGVLALTIWIFYRFNESYTPKSKVPIKILNALTAFKSIFEHRRLYKVYLINFLIFFSVFGLYRVAPLYVVDEWKPSLHVYSLLISYVSLLCLIANLVILGKLTKWFSVQTLLSGLLIIGGILVFLIIIPTHFNWIWITYGLAVIPTAMALPTCTTWLSQQVQSYEQGQALGNNQALLVLGESSSAAIGGLIAAILVPLPLIVLGIILLGTGIALIYLKRNSEGA